MPRFIATLVILFVPFYFALGQSMVYDSLKINFDSEKKITFGIKIDTIIDARNQDSRFIGVHETNKYLYIPVDRFLTIDNPLAHEIKSLFEDDLEIMPSLKSFKLEINEFNLTTKTVLFSKKYVAYATIKVFERSEDDGYTLKGNLLYETAASPKGFSAKERTGYENVLEVWKNQFSNDLIIISACPQHDPNCKLLNLIDESLSLNKNLFINVEAFYWHTSWLMDGEFIFSRPESQKRFHRKAFCLRYRNDEKFQSFETSLNNDQFNYRLSKNFVMVIKSKLFLGINLWNDSEYKTRGFEDIFLLDYSLGQNILFNPYYKKGFTAGIGVLGSINYIYSEGLSIKPYISIQLGAKL